MYVSSPSQANLITCSDIIIDSKSGISGAGLSSCETTLCLSSPLPLSQSHTHPHQPKKKKAHIHLLCSEQIDSGTIFGSHIHLYRLKVHNEGVFQRRRTCFWTNKQGIVQKRPVHPLKRQKAYMHMALQNIIMVSSWSYCSIQAKAIIYFFLFGYLVPAYELIHRLAFVCLVLW